MNQNQRRSRALFLIVKAHSVDNGEVAVGGVGNAGRNVVERNVGGPRKPKDSQRNRRHQNQHEQKFEEFFDQAVKITLGRAAQQARRRGSVESSATRTNDNSPALQCWVRDDT